MPSGSLLGGPTAMRPGTRARHWLARNRELVPRATTGWAQGRSEYWEGRILEKQRRSKDAIGWYQQAVRRYPLAVYALLAFQPPGGDRAAGSGQPATRADPTDTGVAGPGPAASPALRAPSGGPSGEARATLDRAVEKVEEETGRSRPDLPVFVFRFL